MFGVEPAIRLATGPGQGLIEIVVDMTRTG